MNKLPLNLRDQQMFSKSYAAFRGCDFTTDKAEVDDTRSPDSLNMLADDAGFPEKRVGWRVLEHFPGKINGLHYAHFDGCSPVIIVHHGTQLTAYDYAENRPIFLTDDVNDAPSVSFAHGDFLYFMDGEHFIRIFFDGDGISGEPVRGVAMEPVTGRGGHYEATVEKDENDDDVTVYTWVPCSSYQEPNILTDKMSNTFAGDGVNTEFWLTEKGCTVSGLCQRAGDGWIDWVASYTVSEDPVMGKTKITFTTAPAAAAEGAGIDSFKVQFTTTDYTASPETIEHCTIATQYGYFNDNRFFVSGNPAKKNRDWACAVDNPTYWELNQWTDIGSDQTAIMGYLHYGDTLAIIKEDDNQDAEIYVRTAQEQSDNSILFPVQQGIKGVGAISRYGFASLRDDALFYAREGVFAVYGTDASQMRTIQNRSYFVDNKLRNETGKENAVAAVWNNLLVLAFPSSGHCYVADCKQQTPFNESFVYEWFYWDNVPASRFLSFDGELYFGTPDGDFCKFNSDFDSNIKYTDSLDRRRWSFWDIDFNDIDFGYIGTLEDDTWKVGGEPVKARWTTRADALGIMHKLKTMTKRGCVCVLKPISGSSVDIYVTTDGHSKAEINSQEQPVLWDFENVDFGDFAFGGLGTPQIVPYNSKVKKFKMLQMTFENSKPRQGFGVYGAQIQYTINNYIK